jgi:hypothetical protein
MQGFFVKRIEPIDHLSKSTPLCGCLQSKNFMPPVFLRRKDYFTSLMIQHYDYSEFQAGAVVRQNPV